MRRLALSAACVLLLWSCAQAQMRGGRAGPAGVGLRGTVVANRGFGFGGRGRAGVVIRTFPGSFSHRRFHQQFFPYYPAWYGYTPYAYYGGYYPLWNSYSGPYQSTQNDEEVGQLYSEINRLSNEVEGLREQQEARYYPPQPSTPPASTPLRRPESVPAPEPTTLVFRDGQRERVTNYAVVGETLWILDEQHARKVPFAAIDVGVTRSLNEDAGIEFNVPAEPAR